MTLTKIKKYWRKLLPDMTCPDVTNKLAKDETP